ncbi:Cuticle protein 16.8 like protein [Argiope bruennichi]|uniref:Cuticle protein 16.8 like protein n=1 Tax=Argiope bruennichi TaxID=94029 RepID=A0A8T0EM54_ARGBR|nr:Cuticle protein 16.8 like protein [Argiope bruennichi]
MLFKGLLLLSIAAVALAQYGHGYGAPAPAYGHNDYVSFPNPSPTKNGTTSPVTRGNSKQTPQEHGDGHGNVQGSYGYVDAHGISRQVDYVADGHGFRAQNQNHTSRNESQNPADVELHANPVHVAQPAYGAPAPRHGYGPY